MSIVCFAIGVEPAVIGRNKIKANWGSRKRLPSFFIYKTEFLPTFNENN